MASVVSICNRALQKLGAKRINSLTEDTPNARSCNAAYEILRDAELRSHPWNFAISRAELAADSDSPDFGRTYAFQLPVDCLKVLPPYPEDNFVDLDWQIEGKKIYTDETAPLEIRYIKKVTDPNEMDPLFQEALSAKIAWELCEEITQSNSKLQALKEDYKDAIARAKKANAIERPSVISPDDTWLTSRN